MNPPGMRESRWFGAKALGRLLPYVDKHCSKRKKRLLVVACTRLCWKPGQESLERAIEISEQLADGRQPPGVGWLRDQVDRTGRHARPSTRDDLRHSVIATVLPLPRSIATLLTVNRERREQLEAGFIQFVHDVVGNPYQVATFDSRWQTDDTVGLARGIYEDRAFHRMPLLADALMDAGCDDDQIISHCRSGGPHVRGCWVVDLILGRQ